MNKRKNNQKPGANIVRISRLESIKPINISTGNFDFKKQFYNPSLTLFLLYVSIIIIETLWQEVSQGRFLSYQLINKNLRRS